MDFDKAFTRIASITNTSAGAIEGMKAEVLALAGETAQSPVELADALFFLSSAGLDAAEVMPALEMAAKASAVGLGATADVANIVASALNAYSESGLTAAQATDVLVAAVREGRAEPEEFANALGRILPIASTVGVTFDQVAASMSALSNIGLDVNEGVTAMRGVLQAIAAPGTQAADAMDALGLSAQQLLDAIAEDGVIGALRLLDAAAKKQTDTQAGYNDALRKIIPNVRALTGVLGLTGQEAEKVDGIFDRVLNSTGSLGTAFGTTAESDAFKLQQALNDIAIAGQELATEVLPGLANALSAIADVLGPVIEDMGAFVAIIAGAKLGLGAMAGAAAVGSGGFQELTLAEAEAISGMELGNETFGDFNVTAGATATQLEAVAAAMASGDPVLASMRAHWIGLGQDFLGVSRRSGEAQSAFSGVAGALGTLLPFLGSTEDGLDGVAGGHRRVAAAARDQRNAELALVDPLLAVLDSADQLQTAQAEVNRLRRKGKQDTEEYRDAVRGELQAYIGVKQGVADYAAQLDTAGLSHRQIVGQVQKLGRELGLTKGDIRAVINELDDIPGNVTVKLKADTTSANATIGALEGRMAQLIAHDYELRIHATTSGGSTAFDLIDHLTAELEKLTERRWHVDMHLIGIAQVDQARAYQKELREIEKRFEKLRDRASEFRQAIRSGFADFADLVGGMVGLLDEFAQAQANLEEGGVAPTAPDLGAFLTGQVAATQQFADVLGQLQTAGLSQGNLADLASQGPAALGVAQALLADPALIAAMNEAQRAIADIIGDTANSLTDTAFGEKFERLGRDFDRLLSQLNRFIDSIPVPELKDETREFIGALQRLRRVIDQAGGGGGGAGGGGGGGGALGNTLQSEAENDALAKAIVREMNKNLDPKVLPVAGFSNGVLGVVSAAGNRRAPQ